MTIKKIVANGTGISVVTSDAECKDIFFVSTVDEAVERLCKDQCV